MFAPAGFHPVPTRAMPDWNHVHAELRRRGVTLLLLWEEYRAERAPPLRQLDAGAPVVLFVIVRVRGVLDHQPCSNVARSTDAAPLERLLPQAPAGDEGAALSPLRRQSGWASTLIACLELTKQGEVATTQDGNFAPILVSRAPAAEPAGITGTPKAGMDRVPDRARLVRQETDRKVGGRRRQGP